VKRRREEDEIRRGRWRGYQGKGNRRRGVRKRRKEDSKGGQARRSTGRGITESSSGSRLQSHSSDTHPL
jgi:hypothetical protein